LFYGKIPVGIVPEIIFFGRAPCVFLAPDDVAVRFPLVFNQFDEPIK
jgi:hypothetical protein